MHERPAAPRGARVWDDRGVLAGLMHVVAPLMSLSEHHMRTFHAVGAPTSTPMHVCVTLTVMEPIEFPADSRPSLRATHPSGVVANMVLAAFYSDLIDALWRGFLGTCWEASDRFGKRIRGRGGVVVYVDFNSKRHLRKVQRDNSQRQSRTPGCPQHFPNTRVQTCP